MGVMRRTYYDLFSKVYDFIIRLHSSDRAGSLRRFIAERTCLSEGERALDLCTGTGSVAVELTKYVGEKGFVVGLDFSRGMIEKARQKAATLNLNHLYLVQGNASRLPFKGCSFHGVTCSHAFYELKGAERSQAVKEAERVLKPKGKFSLMEHAKPDRFSTRLLFYVRIFFLGASDAKEFLEKGEAVLGEGFTNITKELSPTGQSKLIQGEKEGDL
jgi:demethylmenaquinone methyltransferase/2-methoxy-6-polyprenyl-1,4-benzoquinol methylase